MFVFSSSWLLLFVIIVTGIKVCTGQSYADVKQVFEDKLDSSVYDTDARPMNNQAMTMTVMVSFNFLSIVDIDDVTGQFSINGFLILEWMDQRVSWNSSEYGGLKEIFPQPKRIWRPRVLLLNTMGERDLFGDKPGALIVASFGRVWWYPGTIFYASCNMNMRKYPFDDQTCSLELISSGISSSNLLFAAQKVDTDFFAENGAWEVLNSSISAESSLVANIPMSLIKINFNLRRRPMYMLVNILLPVVLLSALSLLSFLIPVESGEKISYGVTSLLAMAVFLSIVSTMLPSSSTSIPLIIVYILILLIISLLVVVSSIVVVYLYHLNTTDETKDRNANDTLIGSPQKKFTLSKAAVVPYDDSMRRGSSNSSISRESSDQTDTKSKRVSKILNAVCFVTLGLIWTAATIGFLVALTV